MFSIFGFKNNTLQNKVTVHRKCSTFNKDFKKFTNTNLLNCTEKYTVHCKLKHTRSSVKLSKAAFNVFIIVHCFNMPLLFFIFQSKFIRAKEQMENAKRTYEVNKYTF